MVIYGGIENVFKYLDDLLTFGNTEAQYDSVLQKVLNLVTKNNIKFNKSKIQFKVNEVSYLGHIFPSNGMK